MVLFFYVDDNKDVSRIQLHSSLAIGGNKVKIEDFGLSLLIVKVIFFVWIGECLVPTTEFVGHKKGRIAAISMSFLSK